MRTASDWFSSYRSHTFDEVFEGGQPREPYRQIVRRFGELSREEYARRQAITELALTDLETLPVPLATLSDRVRQVYFGPAVGA